MRTGLIPRMIGLGAATGAAAVLLWVAFAWWPELLVLPAVIATALTAACGIFVLLATWYDIGRNPRRGTRIRPIRGFDIMAGLILAAPSIWTLWPFLRAL